MTIGVEAAYVQHLIDTIKDKEDEIEQLINEKARLQAIIEELRTQREERGQ